MLASGARSEDYGHVAEPGLRRSLGDRRDPERDLHRQQRQRRGGSLKARVTLLLTILVATVGCDQISKQIMRAALEPRRSYPLLGGFLRLWLIENPGAFLSLGADLPAAARTAVFVGALGAGLLAAAAFLLQASHISRSSFAAGALVLAGGVSNWLDRLMREGRVTDFAVLAAGPLHTGVFNLADVAITTGVVLLLASLARGRS